MLLIDFIPVWLVLLASGSLGVVIGSFLNVVVYRLHTNRSLSGRSHCLACGYTLRWFDLLPIVSYVLLRARCRRCGARITPRYALVEGLTGVLFAFSALLTPVWLPLVFILCIQAVLVVIIVYDYYHLIIPDRTVLWLLALAAGWLGYEVWLGMSWATLGSTIAVALAGGSVFAFLWLISKGRWIGLGDAKLAVPLGMIVGISGVFSLVVFSFWVGALISLAILTGQALVRRGQPHLRFLSQPLTIKSEVPFAPFLVISFWLIYFFGFDALELTTLFYTL